MYFHFISEKEFIDIRRIEKEHTYPRLEDVFDINVVTLKRNMNKYIITNTPEKG